MLTLTRVANGEKSGGLVYLNHVYTKYIVYTYRGICFITVRPGWDSDTLCKWRVVRVPHLERVFVVCPLRVPEKTPGVLTHAAYQKIWPLPRPRCAFNPQPSLTPARPSSCLNVNQGSFKH